MPVGDDQPAGSNQGKQLLQTINIVLLVGVEKEDIDQTADD
jgi:hypothetical protein